MGMYDNEQMSQVSERDIRSAPQVETGDRFRRGDVSRPGDVINYSDGRQFRYVSTAADLAAGEIVAWRTAQAAALDNKLSVAAINATTLVIDTSGTALFGAGAGVVVANDLAGGFIVIEDDTGEGHQYRIKSNTVGTSATSITVVLWDKLKVAVDATTDVFLIGPKYRKVVEGAILLSPIGVCMTATTAATAGVDQYFWVQTRGLAAVLVKTGTGIAIGKLVSAVADGGCILAAGHDTNILGTAMGTTTTSGATVAVNLCLE